MKTKLRNRRKAHENLLTDAHENVIRLEANINYTTFVLDTGKQQTMSYTLAMYDTILPETFIRINKSYIINKIFIKSLNSENKKITLTDGSEFQISRRRWNDVSENVA